MLKIEVTDWEGARGRAMPIRLEVFVEEQRVPVEIEQDEWDEKSVHAIALEDGVPVGTGRLLPDGHIGRMAVLKSHRNRGIGGLLLKGLMERARQRGDAQIVLSAQVQAVRFYLEHGFRAEGPVYEEAGIAHQVMRCPL